MLQIDSILSCISVRYNLANLGSATHLSNKKYVIERLVFQKMRKMGFRCVLIIRKKPSINGKGPQVMRIAFNPCGKSDQFVLHLELVT